MAARWSSARRPAHVKAREDARARGRRGARPRPCCCCSARALLGGLVAWLVAASIRRPALRLRDALWNSSHAATCPIEVPHQDLRKRSGRTGAFGSGAAARGATDGRHQHWLKGHLARIAQCPADSDQLPTISRHLFFSELAACRGPTASCPVGVIQDGRGARTTQDVAAPARRPVLARPTRAPSEQSGEGTGPTGHVSAAAGERRWCAGRWPRRAVGRTRAARCWTNSCRCWR
jgi:hypothetical protein